MEYMCVYLHGFLLSFYTNDNTCTLCAWQAAAKKQKMDKDDEERIQEAIERQIERALASKKDVSRRIIAISICTSMILLTKKWS